MHSQDTLSLKWAMKGPWYKECGTFLMVPAFAILACYLIPIFHCEQGLSPMAMIALTVTFSYGHTFSPRKPQYEKWQPFMNYPAFILASVKKNLSFAISTGLTAWITTLCFSGYPKELALLFEAAVWWLASGICFCALLTYAGETFKLRKIGGENYRMQLANLQKWIALPTIVFLLLAIAKSYLLFEMVQGRV